MQMLGIASYQKVHAGVCPQLSNITYGWTSNVIDILCKYFDLPNEEFVDSFDVGGLPPIPESSEVYFSSEDDILEEENDGNKSNKGYKLLVGTLLLTTMIVVGAALRTT